MNYRHSYHAGNFADVIKHLVLIILLQSLQRKENPFCFLDTHAGIGLYALDSVEAQKSQEYHEGIEKLLSLDNQHIPLVLQQYIHIVKKYNVSDGVHYYPGSPMIARDFLRAQDRAILCELHKEDIHTLKKNFMRDEQVAVHHMDAYLGMKAFLPFKQKRGLVLIDPPFEVTDEFERIALALENALMRWRSGHFMVWYPIKHEERVASFYRKVGALIAEHLILHFSLNEIAESGKLAQCGILLVNPPWQTKEAIESVLPFLIESMNASCEFFTAA
jgi:23S rRNA (adenine2030-N6)-methyltransferase